MPIAANIVDIVAADDDVKGWGTSGCAANGSSGRDGGAVDLPDDVVCDQEIVEAAGSYGAIGAEDDTAVVLLFVGAVDVMNIEAGDDDVLGGAEIIENDVDAAPDCRLSAVIGDFEVMNFDLLHIAEQNYVVDCSVAFDTRTRAFAVAVEDNGRGGEPELRGASCSCQISAARRRMRSPGLNSVAPDFGESFPRRG